MRNIKFLILAGMALAFCTGQVHAQVVALADGLGPNFQVFQVGDTVIRGVG